MSLEQKAAFVAVVGRPSAGKSTMVNLFCGAKVAIVSTVPQTTRNAIRGILSRPEGQLVFVDTPGRHTSERKLNKKLMEVSDRALEDSELVLYVLDASRAPGIEEEAIAERLLPLTGKTVAAINKMDLPSADAERAIRFLREKLPDLPPSRCFKVSCLQRQEESAVPEDAVPTGTAGAEAVVSCLFEMADVGEPMYPEEYYTDQEIPFRIAEIIREKAMNRLREELPHSLYVQVEDTELKTDDSGRQILWVRAFIITERESQKGMIVGKGGQMIKAIRLAALKDLNAIFEWKVDLDLRVKTGKDWRHNDKVLRRIIERP
jgi:GTP-binding protein Era